LRTDGQTDGRTDMVKLIVAFHKFENARKNMKKYNAGERRTLVSHNTTVYMY